MTARAMSSDSSARIDGGVSKNGRFYEGVMRSAPKELQFLLLSGAVANPDEVAAWLRRLGRVPEVIVHRERPVELEEVEADDLVHGLPRCIEGFWARRVAGALREGMGPVLVFAPHRHDAVRLNRLRLLGWTVLRFTADDVLRNPDRMVAQVRAALKR